MNTFRLKKKKHLIKSYGTVKTEQTVWIHRLTSLHWVHMSDGTFSHNVDHTQYTVKILIITRAFIRNIHSGIY